MRIDTLPYKTFKKLRTKYPAVMISYTARELTQPWVRAAYKSYLDYIKGKFKEKGVEILRVTHDYKSLDTAHPQLGVVVLAGDSVLEDRTEVWALIGHNARYIDQVEVRGQEA